MSLDLEPDLIAEVKTKSPFGYESEHSWDHLLGYAIEVGDMVSVHTHEDWGGSFEQLEEACQATDKPVVAKGFHQSNDLVAKCVEAGAEYVLTVSFVPTIAQNRILAEPKSLHGLSTLPPNMRAVWNSRDPDSGLKKRKKISDARAMWDGWLCQASNISHVDDVYEGVEAILVGKDLKPFVRSVNNGSC